MTRLRRLARACASWAPRTTTTTSDRCTATHAPAPSPDTDAASPTTRPRIPVARTTSGLQRYVRGYQQNDDPSGCR